VVKRSIDRFSHLEQLPGLGTDDAPQPFDFAAYVKMLVTITQFHVALANRIAASADCPRGLRLHPISSSLRNPGTYRSKLRVGWKLKFDLTKSIKRISTAFAPVSSNSMRQASTLALSLQRRMAASVRFSGDGYPCPGPTM